MSDERWSPHHQTSEPPKRPPETLWTLSVAGVTWSTELRFHGVPAGWEAMILRDSELFTARGAFLLKGDAIRWTEAQRRDIERGLFEEL